MEFENPYGEMPIKHVCMYVWMDVCTDVCVCMYVHLVWQHEIEAKCVSQSKMTAKR